MKNYAGIWVDRRKAFIVSMDRSVYSYDSDSAPTTLEIPSGVEERVPKTGGMRTAHPPWAPQYGVPESRSEARQQRQLNAFFGRLIGAIQTADRILIMGPGETKHGLMRAIRKLPAFASRVAGVETCDKMTPHQIAAKIRAFFHL